MFILQTKNFIKCVIVNIINMNEEEILIENTGKFLESAELVYKNKDFTSAAILYFKALFSALDLIILKETGKTPKDHSERFRILEARNHELYEELDKLYPKFLYCNNNQRRLR